MSLATFSVSERIAAMVELIESAASAVSSTAAVIIVTVCACSSIAWRMRSAEVWTSSTVPWIEPLASTVWRVACWMAVILAVMSSVARAVWRRGSSLPGRRPRSRGRHRRRGRLDGRVEASKLVWPAMSRIRPRIDSIASTWPDSAWLTLTAWLGLVAGAGRDAGGDLDLGPGILDRADQAGGGLRRFAHRDRRLLGGGGDFAGLAEHAARRGQMAPEPPGDPYRIVGEQGGDLAAIAFEAAVAIEQGDPLRHLHLGEFAAHSNAFSPVPALPAGSGRKGLTSR
jgi:hypothetical protein